MTRLRPRGLRLIRALAIRGLIFQALFAASTMVIFPPFTPAFAAPGDDGMEEREGVRLRVLDKITARTSTFDLKVGASAHFGGLTIVARSCLKSPPSAPPEAAAFLEIEETTAEGTLQPAFSGWMFASSPALSAMESAVYDVWVLQCLPD